jgi:hypothetical protein
MYRSWGWQLHPGKKSHENWRSNSRPGLAEASEEGQGPHRTVEPMMMMMNIRTMKHTNEVVEAIELINIAFRKFCVVRVIEKMSNVCEGTLLRHRPNKTFWCSLKSISWFPFYHGNYEPLQLVMWNFGMGICYKHTYTYFVSHGLYLKSCGP